MRSSTRKVKDLSIFAMLATIILVSQVALAAIPGVQLVGMLIASISVAYKKRALIPIYAFALLFCLYWGFFPWNLPYFYIWLPLWGLFMLAEKAALPPKTRRFVYAALCSLFGLLFGVLYAPAQALLFGLNLEQTVAWVIAGIPTSITTAASNFAAGLLIIPLSDLMKKLDKHSGGVTA